MTAGFEMGENLGEVVAHHRAEHHMGQPCLAQVDEVAEADAQQVGEFLFSQPVCGWGRCIGAHAYQGRVNLVMPCASSLRNGRWPADMPLLANVASSKSNIALQQYQTRDMSPEIRNQHRCITPVIRNRAETRPAWLWPSMS